MIEDLLPIGHPVGVMGSNERGAVELYQIRRGREIISVYPAHWNLWVLMRGHRPTPSRIAPVDVDGLARAYLELDDHDRRSRPGDAGPLLNRADVGSAIDDLRAAGLAYRLDRGSTASMTEFAGRHRLVAFMSGLGNLRAAPDTFALGYPGGEPVFVSRLGMHLWTRAHEVRGLGEEIDTLREQSASADGDPQLEAGNLMLDEARALLAVGAAVLDVV
ncbi:hypothetical protein [Blastococcus sp. Marseille-P5729]|uniref:hypothetical protein n=1 Tax=Blastococcus sp. Marseille-P5729 TaxID=2086582 RepID=UPI000D0F9C6A|nr:hypothetical protein [Blastococcus sp. Marseille-P5729]